MKIKPYCMIDYVLNQKIYNIMLDVLANNHGMIIIRKGIVFLYHFFEAIYPQKWYNDLVIEIMERDGVEILEKIQETNVDQHVTNYLDEILDHYLKPVDSAMLCSLK